MDESTKVDAFTTMLTRCMSVRPDDEVLAIMDESMSPHLDALLAALAQTRAAATLVFMPLRQQRDLLSRSRGPATGRGLELPAGLAAAIQESSAILSLLQGNPETAMLRRSIVQHPRFGDARLAHIPGVTEAILTLLASSPVEQIGLDCERVAWALGEATRAMLETYDDDGSAFQLNMSLDGWDNEPLMSPCVIEPGSWGNLPSGETFCCPDPSLVDGQLCLNGSVPGAVLSRGEQVILTFSAGRLTSWDGGKSSPAFQFLERERRDAEAREDENWNLIAEFGIGLNPAVTALSGHSLYDEKMRTTAHVAIGDNSAFGHSIRAGIHADLLLCRPTVHLDDRTLIDKGELRLEEIDGWRTAPGNSLPPLPTIERGRSVFLRHARVKIIGDVLFRRLHKAQRHGAVRMGTALESRALVLLYRVLNDAEAISVGELLRRHPALLDIPTEKLLTIMYHYRAVRFTD